MDNHDSRLRNRVKGLPKPLRRRLAIAGIVLLGLLMWLIYNQYDSYKWNKFVAALDAQAGIVVTDSERNRKNYIVRGLKDPLASDATMLLTNSGLNTERVKFEFEPYQALQPEFSIKRIKSVLMPPNGVDLVLDGSILRITGAKSNSWIADAKRLTRQFSEISHVTFGPTTQ